MSALVDVAIVGLAAAATTAVAVSAAGDDGLFATFVGACANDGAAKTKRQTTISCFMFVQRAVEQR